MRRVPLLLAFVLLSGMALWRYSQGQGIVFQAQKAQDLRPQESEKAPERPTQTNGSTELQDTPAPATPGTRKDPLAKSPSSNQQDTDGGAEEPGSPQKNTDVRAWLLSVKPEVLEALGDKSLAQLEELDLRGTKITDADLALIAQLTGLRSLSLRGTLVTDFGIWQLGALTSLEDLSLRSTQITSAGLQTLPTANLKHLDICSSKVAVEDLRYAPAMPNLTVFKANFMNYPDEVIDHLAQYQNLQHVELDQNNITDAGLTQLMESNPNIRRVEIRRTQVTSTHLVLMRDRYPNCEFLTR